MTIRFPNPLNTGDLIAITAPSMGVPTELHPRLDLAIQAIKQQGYEVIEGQCLREVYKNKSAERSARAQELMTYLSQPEIKAVMPPWGGELAMELLELIDFDRLATRKPKWFSGYSDLSTLHFPLTTLAGWATLHGPNLMELGAKQLDETTAKIWQVLKAESGGEITQYSSLAYQAEGKDWKTAPEAGFQLTQPTEWKRLDGETASVSVKGRLIGGCLDTLSRLAGTRFGNLPQFCEQNKTDGVILYIENVEMRPCELTRALVSLRMQGWFNNISGLLIGRSAAPNANEPSRQNYLDALTSALGHLTIPVIYDVDIGHVPPQLSLINGALTTVLFEGKGGRVTQHI